MTQRDLRTKSREIMDAVGLPLYTTNPADFTALDSLARIIPVTRPPVPHKRSIS